MVTLKVATFSAALVFGSLFLNPRAEACSGFIACTFVKPFFGDHFATELDKLNARSGKIVDHGVAYLLNVTIPGSGTLLEGYWSAQAIIDAYDNGSLELDEANQALAMLGN